MSENKTVAIVVTFRRKELLLEVINSLTKQECIPYKILVIDNNSQDGTEELVRKLACEYSNILYYNTGDNLGGAGGFHYGFKVAEEFDYDYLWLMDDDLKPEASCLKEMLALNHDGIVQPIRFNLDGSCAELSPVKYDLKSFFSINPKKSTVIDLYQKKQIIGNVEIEGIPFEGPLISRNLINKIGYPNPDFFIFYDDLDYAIRTRQAGFKIICNKKIVAKRLLVNNQKNDLLSWKGYFMLRNLFYIHFKYGENWLVKSKPIIIALGYGLISLLKGNLKQVKVVKDAFFDAFSLRNSNAHKPK